MAGTRTVLDLTLKPETRERVKSFGLRVNPRISLPPGRYHVRIGARDAVAGMTGSVFYDLEVPDFRKEKLMMGGLLLASAMGQQTPSIQPDPVLEKVMPAAATSRREFSQRDLIALYTEIYDNIGSDAGAPRRPCRAPALGEWRGGVRGPRRDRRTEASRRRRRGTSTATPERSR